MSREELQALLDEKMTEIFTLGNEGKFLEAQAKRDELLDLILKGFE